MCLDKLVIKSNIKNYDVLFEENAKFIEDLPNNPNMVFIVDEKVWHLYKETYLKPLPETKLIVLRVSEEIKNIDSVLSLYTEIMKFAPKKNMTIVSFGGGIIQDITGFVASTLYRGVNWLFIPTTLLAQDDSCIGAKTSLNFLRYKNLIGSFYPPSTVYIYPGFLNSLSYLDFYSGVGEMAKLHAMDGESSLLAFIDSLPELDRKNPAVLLNCIQKCLVIKKDYIEKDEFDTGRRNMLNYGHCFGHALETATDYAIPHGQAVLLGMMLANEAAVSRGLLSADKQLFIEKNVLLPSLKYELNGLNLDIRKTVNAMGQDKKNTGKGLALVMLENDFKMTKVTDLRQEEATRLLSDFREKMCYGRSKIN